MSTSASKSLEYQILYQGRIAPRILGVLGVLSLGTLVALAPVKWVAAGIMGVAGGLLVFVRPIWGVYALAFAIPFGSLREVTLAGVSMGAADALAALVVVAWLARMVAHRQIRIIWPPLALPLFLLLMAMGLSLTVTAALIPSLKEIVKWLEVLVIYVFLANVAGRKEAKRLLIGLFLAASAQALLGIYQFVRGVGPEGFLLMGRFMRAYGTFRQPNPFAGYLGLHLPLALGVLAGDWRGLAEAWRERDWERLLLVWSAVVASLLMIGGLLASWSRGGWLGFAVALAVMVLLSQRRMLLVVLLITGFLALFVASGGLSSLPPSVVSRVTDALPYASGIDLRTVEIDDSNWSLIERMAHWQAAWDMFLANPWLGIGIGNYAVVYPAYALPRWQDPLGHAHNYYLNIASEAGLVGLGAYLLFWLASFAQALRASGESTTLWRGISLGVLGLFVHLSVHNAVDNLYVNSMQLVIAFALAFLYQARQGKRERSACVLA